MNPRLPGRIRAVSLALGLALTVAACGPAGGAGGGSSADAKPEFEISQGFHNVKEPDGAPVDGGTLTLSEYSEARSLNTTQTIAHGSAGGNALAAVYDVLVKYDDKAHEFVPQLAKSIESNDDLTEWTLGLREGVTFSDGTPLNAKAVLGSIGYYMKNRGSDTGLLATFIEGMQAKDEHTVVFKLRAPWSTFPYMLSRGAGMIMAPAAYSGAEFKPIGAGPFQLENYAPGEKMTLTAREDYWDGKPHLDKIELNFLDSDQARLDVLKSGAADIVHLREGPQVWEAAENYPGYMSLSSMGDVILVNNRKGRPGADPRVRKAMMLAVNPAAIYQRAQEGKGVPVKKVFSEQSKWFNAAIEDPQANVEEAKRLLDEAKADGFDGKVGYLGGSGPVGRAEALATKAMLEQAGFEVNVEYIRTIADRIERMYVQHDFDIARAGSALTEMSPFEGLYSALSSHSFLNSIGYASQELDGLLGRLQGARDDEARRQVLGEIEKHIVEHAPVINMGTKASYYPWQKNVHGVEVSADEILLLGKAWVAK